jgi:murein DD-endopeptidase MepM/ murein hydrolase activator NlpD
MINQKLKLFISNSLKKTVKVSKDVSYFIKQCLGSKKIVIISEKGISSLPVSFKFQATVVGVVLTFMLWVSFSTGKYFAYENTISKKDREIWSTNITNENLQFQVADLHDNLLELNKYFDDIKKYGQVTDKEKLDKEKDESTRSKVSRFFKRDKISDIGSESAIQGVLSNIRNKVMDRIGNLESIIEITGLKVQDVAAQNAGLKKVLINKDYANSHQGGEFIPADGQEADMFDSRNFDKEVNYLMQLEKVIHSFPISPPLKRYWISSGFGTRTDPIRGRVATHTGIDLVGQNRAKIYSTAPGVVKFAGFFSAYGRFIEIDHGSGVTTRYGHLDEILVEEGERVERGQLIGLQGNSGRSTGTHLHYEVRYNNKAYDPKNFLRAGKYVF